MKRSQVVEQVAQAMGPGDAGLAEPVLHAVLSALGERLPEEGRRVLAGRLDPELADVVTATEPHESEDFVARLARHEGLRPARAARDARLCLGVLAEAIGGEAVEQLRGVAPEDVSDLLPAAPAASHGDVPAYDPPDPRGRGRRVGSGGPDPRSLAGALPSSKSLAEAGPAPRSLGGAAPSARSLAAAKPGPDTLSGADHEP